MNAQGFQASGAIFISFRLWSTPNLSHGEIQLSLYYHQLGVRRRENHIGKKKALKKLTYKDVVIETVICFFLSLCYGIQFGWRFVLKTTDKCQILFSAARVVEKKIKFRETAIIFKSITCERLSEVKSTFSTVVSFQSFHLFRFGRFVLLFRVLVHAEIINDITTD